MPDMYLYVGACKKGGVGLTTQAYRKEWYTVVKPTPPILVNYVCRVTDLRHFIN